MNKAKSLLSKLEGFAPSIFLVLSGVGFGYLLDQIWSLEMINNELSFTFLVTLGIMLLLLVYSLKDFFKSHLVVSERLSMIFIGVALISFMLATYRFSRIVILFSTEGYATQWVIGGKPYVYYPPDMIYGSIRSSFLTAMFSLLERIVHLF
jgi:hypothetical protein